GILASWENDAGSWVVGGSVGGVPSGAVLSAGDIDGDGVDELVVASPQNGSGGLYWAGLSSAGALFVDTVDADFAGANALAVADLDADGVADIVVAVPSHNTAPHSQRHGEGFARFDLATDLRSVVDVALADAEGDGDLDLLLGTTAGAAPFFRSSFTSPVKWRSAPVDRVFVNAGELATADLDGDGFL